jgi:hypothetical protein
MSSFKRAVVCGFGAWLLWGPAPAASEPFSSFSIPVGAAVLDNGAAAGSLGILLPASGTPNLSFTFSLPRDYVDDSVVTVSLLVSPFQGSAPCNVRIVPFQMARRRAGTNALIALAGVSGNPLIHFASNKDVAKNFKIAPGPGLPNLKRGDSISLTLMRDADHSTDTCGANVDVNAIDIRYHVRRAAQIN